MPGQRRTGLLAGGGSQYIPPSTTPPQSDPYDPSGALRGVMAQMYGATTPPAGGGTYFPGTTAPRGQVAATNLAQQNAAQGALSAIPSDAEIAAQQMGIPQGNPQSWWQSLLMNPQLLQSMDSNTLRNLLMQLLQSQSQGGM